MQTLGKQRTAWKPPIIRTVAVGTAGENVPQLVDAIEKHRAWAIESGEQGRRRRDAARAEVEDLLLKTLVRRLRDQLGSERVDDAVARVADRVLDPYAAVRELLEG